MASTRTSPSLDAKDGEDETERTDAENDMEEKEDSVTEWIRQKASTVFRHIKEVRTIRPTRTRAVFTRASHLEVVLAPADPLRQGVSQ